MTTTTTTTTTATAAAAGNNVIAQMNIGLLPGVPPVESSLLIADRMQDKICRFLAIVPRGPDYLWGLRRVDATYAHDGRTISEPTLVVWVNAPADLVRGLARIVCAVASQDCVAVRWPDGSGELIGPRADQWGEFDPAMFIRY